MNCATTERTVIATVIAVTAEFRQAKLITGDGFLYALTAKTAGVCLADVREGQTYHCVVTTGHLPRVVRATLL